MTTAYKRRSDDVNSKVAIDHYTLSFDLDGRPRPPHKGFVISRNNDGSILSQYQDSVWDLKSFCNTVKENRKIYFDKWEMQKPDFHMCSLTEEYRWYCFILFYYSNEGRANYLSVSTLTVYANILFEICKHAYSYRHNLCQFFSTRRGFSFSAFISKLSSNKTIKLSGLANQISKFDNRLTHIQNFNHEGLKQLQQIAFKNRQSKQQTYIIPSRIYALTINRLQEFFKDINPHKSNFIKFLDAVMSDPYCGRSYHPIKGKIGSAKSPHKNNFKQALINHDLLDYATTNSIKSVNDLTPHIKDLHVAAKFLIMAYSGMRSSEVDSLLLGCLETKINSNRTSYRIHGYTTKLSGVKTKTHWITSKEVLSAIETIEEISRTIARHHNIALKNCYLFISAANINSKWSRTGEINTCTNMRYLVPFVNRILADITITEEDLNQLKNYNPILDWDAVPECKPGLTWPLKPHQLRRTLAVYVAQSSLVSLPSLKRQLKHIAREMTLYYTNDSSNTESFFNDPEHFSQEIKKVKPEADAIAYIQNALLSDEALLGGHGKWIEQRKKLNSISLTDRQQTLKQFKNGEIAYIETPLGGCTSTQKCTKRAMRALSSCISCQKAIIKPSKLKSIIEAQQTLLSQINPNTVEYRIEYEQLKDFERFNKQIRNAENEHNH